MFHGLFCQMLMERSSGDSVGVKLIIAGILRNKSICLENCRRKL